MFVLLAPARCPRFCLLFGRTLGSFVLALQTRARAPKTDALFVPGKPMQEVYAAEMQAIPQLAALGKVVQAVVACSGAQLLVGAAVEVDGRGCGRQGLCTALLLGRALMGLLSRRRNTW